MAKKSFFGRLVDKVKSIFVEEPKPTSPPKPSPKPTPVKRKLPTERPQPKKKTPAEIAEAKRKSDLAKKRRLRRQDREKDAFNKIQGFVGNAENAYGDRTFNAPEVRKRLRNLPEQSLVDIIDAKDMAEIDDIYAVTQTEFSGYDQPSQFWYH